MRARRTFWALLVLWTISAVDLSFTLMEANRSHFVEVNPIAAMVVSSPLGVVLFKVCLVAMGSGILLRLSRNAFAEWASWLTAGANVIVLLNWVAYYGHLIGARNDPATNVAPIVVWFLR
ncbi:MAG: DUF5658 family protein [Phycisphaerae bacterium]